MKKAFLVLIVVTVGFSLSLAAIAQGKRSQNIALRVSLRGAIGDPAIYNPFGDKVISDGRGDYIDGVDGVYAKFMVENTPNDFGMNLDQGKTATPRYAYYDFSDQIYPGDGLYTAPWTSYPQVFRSRFHVLHVFSLTADSNSPGFICPTGEVCGQDERGHYMITRGDTGELANGRDSYVLRFDEKSGYEGFIDVPCKTSFFKVYHYNAGVDAGGNPVPEKWIITLAPTSCDYNGQTYTGVIGALTIYDRGLHRAGQYIMPFELTLTRK